MSLYLPHTPVLALGLTYGAQTQHKNSKHVLRHILKEEAHMNMALSWEGCMGNSTDSAAELVVKETSGVIVFSVLVGHHIV